MKKKERCKVPALFLVILIISMPFYSASALAASVQITKNSGQGNIPRYLDAEGDAWTVEATITGSGQDTINPADVKLKIGSNEAAFTSCSPGTLGIVCQYLSPLTDGVQEAEYAFQVIYNFLNQVGTPTSVSNGEVIRADGSAPTISFTHLQQDARGKVEIDFTANDKVRQNAPAVGLKTIEIVDAESGKVLQTITIPEIGKEQFNYRTDAAFDGILQASLAGAGIKRIKVLAADWLGHESAAAVRSFQADFVAPIIKDNLNFTELGRFVGDFVTTTDITIDVEEASVPTVTAASSLAKLEGREADCVEDLEQIGLWHCRWNDVEVNPLQDSISVSITAEDEFGNTAEKTLTKTFTRDSSAPQVDFFGTERVFEGKSYIRSGQQRLILKVSEQGAGIDADGIRANLLALGKSSSEAPAACEDTNSGIECYWDTSAALTGGIARVGLSKFEDKVGNLGSSTEVELVADNSGPKVEKVELYGGSKDYVQSNDQIKLRIKAAESSGLAMLVNVNNVVMDAGNLFPESSSTRGLTPVTGWQAFTENECERAEGGYWECEVLTEQVRSGPENGVELEVRVQDTAGNDAVEWPAEAKNAEIQSARNGAAVLRFDLRGLSLEENPDYWETASVIPLGGESAFIDLETTALAFTRLPLEVRLRSANNEVRMISIDLQDCTVPEQTTAGESVGRELPGEEGPETGTESTETVSTSPVISRSLLYAGVSPEGESLPKPKIVLEFEPFDGKKFFNLPQTGGEHFQTRKADYVCRFRIFSAVDNNALANPELQEVRVSVPFGYSALGAPDARLEELIAEKRAEAGEGILGFIGTLEKIIKWLRYVASIGTTIFGAITIVEGAKNALTTTEFATPLSRPAVIATCFGLNTATKGINNGFELLRSPMAILSCDVPSGVSWYDSWVGYLPKYYNQLMNIEVLQSPDFRGEITINGKKETVQSAWKPARSVYDNFYLSVAALCVPGLVHAADQYRQIICREIYCLENEVKSNVATVSSCSELRGLLTCKYFIGELWYVLPFSQFYDGIIGLLQKALRDPLALAHTANILACGIPCSIGQPSLSAACNFSYWLWDVIEWIENTAAFLVTVADDLEQGGLNYCDSVL